MPRKGKKVNVRRKAKPSNRMSGNAPRKPQAKRVALPQRQLLDSGARAYAQLLRDPCNGPLVGFYGGSGGYIQRFSSVFSVGTTAGTTAGILACYPGAGFISWSDVAGDNTTCTLAGSSATFPGSTFLSSNAKGFRVLAFCLKAYTNASEANRTGYVSYAVVPSTEAPTTGVAYTSPIGVQSLMPKTIRTPADMVEVMWKPGSDDKEYNHNSPGSAVDSSAGGQNALMCAWTGQQAAAGFRIVLTAVIEWLPAANSGFVTDAMRPAASAQSVDEVVRALSMRDPEWWHNTASVAVKVARSAALGYSRGGVLGGIVGGMSAITL